MGNRQTNKLQTNMSILQGYCDANWVISAVKTWPINQINSEFMMFKIGFRMHVWNVLNKNKQGELIQVIQNNK